MSFTEQLPLPALAALVRRLLADDDAGAARVALDELVDNLDPADAEGVDLLVATAADADEASWPAAVDDLLVAIEHRTQPG